MFVSGHLGDRVDLRYFLTGLRQQYLKILNTMSLFFLRSAFWVIGVGFEAYFRGCEDFVFPWM